MKEKMGFGLNMSMISPIHAELCLCWGTLGVTSSIYVMMGESLRLKRYVMKINSKKYIVFDLETTGLYSRRGDRVIEIGAVSIKDGTINDEFHSLVNVPRKISKGAQQVHGITSEMLEGKPTPEQVFPLFKTFIDDAILVAHNAKFDMAFLRAEFHRLGLGLAARYKCTLAMSRKFFPQLPDHRLETVARYILDDGIVTDQHHRALEDARLAAEICIKMLEGAAKAKIVKGTMAY